MNRSLQIALQLKLHGLTLQCATAMPRKPKNYTRSITWLAVWFYAAAHNQYLIRIAPEHFTVWHYKMPFTQDYTLLGILYAGGASISPGGILGALLYVAGRLFDRLRLPTHKLILSTACAISTDILEFRLIGVRARIGTVRSSRSTLISYSRQPSLRGCIGNQVPIIDLTNR